MRQRILIAGAVAALALVTATAALAGTITATATVSGTAGVSLNLPSNPTLSGTIDGTDQTVSYAPCSASSTLAVPAPAGTSRSPRPPSRTARATRSLRAPSPPPRRPVTRARPARRPTNSGIALPLTLSGTAAKFFNAAANTGLGKVDVTPTVQVVIPGNAYAGTYTSTVTLAAATGP